MLVSYLRTFFSRHRFALLPSASTGALDSKFTDEMKEVTRPILDREGARFSISDI